MRSPAHLLDDPLVIDATNRGKILDSVYYLPQQLKQAWEESYETIVPTDCYLVDNIVFSGMGGSALPGRIIDGLAESILKIPFEVSTGYHLPSYVNSRTLVILNSYSGNTEETLTALSEAREKSAQVFCITSGGALKQNAQTYSLAGYFFTPQFNPSGMPRMGGGYPAMGALGLLSKCEHVHFNTDQALSISHYLASQAGNFNSRVPYDQNPAKLLAHSLFGKIPVIVGSSPLMGGCHVFKNMLNENSKTFATLFDIPELNHHLLEGLLFPVTNRNNLIFLFLESQNYHPEIKKRFKITKDVVRQNGIEVLTYHTRSGKPYIEVFEIFQLAGFVSFYLAALNLVDPTPIPWVDYFKQQMAKATI